MYYITEESGIFYIRLADQVQKAKLFGLRFVLVIPDSETQCDEYHLPYSKECVKMKIFLINKNNNIVPKI